MSWNQTFAEPIYLPNDAVATTLHDAVQYISGLPEAEQEIKEWRIAHNIVVQAADQVGSVWFARIAVVRALQRNGGKVARK